MESKQFILGRLRDSRGALNSRSKPRFTPEGVFADIPTTDRDVLIEQFSRKLSALKGDVFKVGSHHEAATKIAQIAREANLTSCGRQRSPLLDRLFSEYQELAALESNMTVVDKEYVPHSVIESMQCAFSSADALIARTGSIVLRTTTAGGRRLSVLPPIHCVVATASQLQQCLSPWLSEVHQDRNWSYGTIITGPSRTADIERILVLGAHGPKRLLVILIDER